MKTGSGYRSRKFAIAASNMVAAIFGYCWAVVAICETAQDFAITTGAFGLVAGAILKLYNDANLRAEEQS